MPTQSPAATCPPPPHAAPGARARCTCQIRSRHVSPAHPMGSFHVAHPKTNTAHARALARPAQPARVHCTGQSSAATWCLPGPLLHRAATVDRAHCAGQSGAATWRLDQSTTPVHQNAQKLPVVRFWASGLRKILPSSPFRAFFALNPTATSVLRKTTSIT